MLDLINLAIYFVQSTHIRETIPLLVCPNKPNLGVQIFSTPVFTYPPSSDSSYYHASFPTTTPVRGSLPVYFLQPCRRGCRQRRRVPLLRRLALGRGLCNFCGRRRTIAPRL